MNDCAFYLKKEAVSCLHASNRWPESALRPPPARSALPTQYIFVST
ncbi:hypothetical protein SFK304_0735 [Shigella flexneri K-304]|uniref:Uncharacterized protein n=1 Tax=Shigella flexneri 2a str. 301 TaxID=198214 RepID=A0AB36P9H4_SHIFL|nr:hypothetical protein SFK671_0628 [Shigella flexneri K-671]EGJ98333.1 hypothetical protein SF293071_0680 [Shigella flexneri 2930-71]EGK27475.1 hypothetical protein SFK218_0831 [Shigella flexneri K-218]EGK40738.1 hypothetical protein SFK304_0735 [Shigella flexneri K-304]EIQ32217.1 hypothetical protein SFK404_0794 [Shigella flexneri K-404]OXB26426.1 hypothetical protein SF301_2829 [Shigella flexneri 2a str. 301]